MSSEACTILPTYTKKPKKRPRQPEQWTRNAMKAKRAKGESYTRADGTVVANFTSESAKTQTKTRQSCCKTTFIFIQGSYTDKFTPLP